MSARVCGGACSNTSSTAAPVGRPLRRPGDRSGRCSDGDAKWLARCSGSKTMLRGTKPLHEVTSRAGVRDPWFRPRSSLKGSLGSKAAIWLAIQRGSQAYVRSRNARRPPPLCGLLGLPVADEGQHEIKPCHLGQRTTPRGVGYETHDDRDRSGCNISSSACAAAGGRCGMRGGTYAGRD